MGVSVLERDWQDLSEIVARAEAGDVNAGTTAMLAVVQICGRATSWQWAIHGDTREFRQGAVKYLCRKGQFRRALRFAMCGRGDMVSKEVGGDGVKVSPRGCGCRFCPRCSRRSGHRFLRRIGGHLEAHGHGEIFHFVLTQPVRGAEEVGTARKRFGGAWKKWYSALRRAGMHSALLTQHVKPREGWGWHFHGHCIVEFKAGVDVEAAGERLEKVWQRACKEEGGHEKELFRRRVCGAGEALGAGGLGQQGEFWAEPVGAVQRVLQYAIRDVVQGCESWVEKLTDDRAICAFAGVIEDAKLHRLFGAWRKAVEQKSAEIEAADGSTALKIADGSGVGSDKVWHELGTMEKVWEEGRNGESWALAILEALILKYSNRGKVCQRLKTVVRCVSDVRRAG